MTKIDLDRMVCIRCGKKMHGDCHEIFKGIKVLDLSVCNGLLVVIGHCTCGGYMGYLFGNN